MVHLKPDQQLIVTQLLAAKADYDQSNPAFERWVAEQRDARKAKIRELVTAAEYAGVPSSRVYKALGFQQPGPYLSFLKQAAGAFGGVGWEPTTQQAVAEPVHVPVTVKFEEGAEDEYIEFSGGPEKQSYVGFTDHPELDFVRIDADWTKKLPNRDEIREAVGAALTEKYGKPVFWYD